MVQEKGIVLYDFLRVRGGAERVTMTLVNNLENADLCYGYRNQGAFPDSMVEDINSFDLYAESRLRGWRYLKVMRAFQQKTEFLEKYDWVIYSGSHSPLAVFNHKAGKNILYCHTIPRFAYDLYDYYAMRYSPMLRPLFALAVAYIRKQYEEAISRMDVVIANSENVQKRLKKYIGVDSMVISPPCDVDVFKWEGQGGYYLSLARLENVKRVDVIIEAFRRMPDKKLIVVSGGEEYETLRMLAKDSENIVFMGWVDDADLKKLIGNAIGTIYIPKDEDFGMSPVESMAAGKPVIGVAEGGLLETIVDGETGVLLSPNPTPDQLAACVRVLTPDRALSMRQACEERAQLFSRERFVSKMREIIGQ